MKKNQIKKIDQFLEIDKDCLEAKLTLGALKLHQGDQSLFNHLMESEYKDHPYMRSFDWVSNLEKFPKLFFNRWKLFDEMINMVIYTGSFLPQLYKDK